jgi:hypothetical protein
MLKEIQVMEEMELLTQAEVVDQLVDLVMQVVIYKMVDQVDQGL